MKSGFFTVNLMKNSVDNMPTIGVMGITIPGGIDCINKINQKCHEYFEHPSHPNIVLHQLNFGPTHHAQNFNRWDIVEDRLMESVNVLIKAGVDFIIIPANTAHKVITSIQSRSSVPIISILDVVADACEHLNLKKVGVMGTKWTMKDHLYEKPLMQRGIQEVLPNESEQEVIQKAIFEELIPNGKASSETISRLLNVVERLKRQGCDGIALACTELPLVLNQQNCGIQVLDTTALLAGAAVSKAVMLLRTKDIESPKTQYGAKL